MQKVKSKEEKNKYFVRFVTLLTKEMIYLSISSVLMEKEQN